MKNFAIMSAITTIVLLFSATVSLSQTPGPEIQFNKRYAIATSHWDSESSPILGLVLMERERMISCLLEDPNKAFTESTSITGIGIRNYQFGIGLDATKTSSIAHNLSNPYPNRLVSFGVSYYEDNFGSPAPTGIAYMVAPVQAQRIEGKSGSLYITCYQNVLRGSFNTNATPFSILELKNSSSGTRIVYIHARSSDGTKLVDKLRRVVEPNTELHVLLHDLVPANSYGSLTVEWLGGPKDLSGNVSRYSPGGPAGLDYKGTTKMDRLSD